MERVMCSCLEWQLNVEPTVIKARKTRAVETVTDPGPYSPLVLPQPASSPFTGSSRPFAHRTLPPQPVPAATATSHQTILFPSPSTPDILSSCHSTSTSPASSTSLPEAPDSHTHQVKIDDMSANYSSVCLVPIESIIANSFHHHHFDPSMPS